jgi:hypothetical protein
MSIAGPGYLRLCEEADLHQFALETSALGVRLAFAPWSRNNVRLSAMRVTDLQLRSSVPAP